MMQEADMEPENPSDKEPEPATPRSDLATEAAEHEVEMRKAKRKAGLIPKDAYYDVTSPVRTPD
jgi:hypothetical protein